MTLERVVLSGFSYEIYEADNGVAWIEFTDAERGIVLEAWFPPEGWAQFKRDAGATKKGIITASADELRRLGV